MESLPFEIAYDMTIMPYKGSLEEWYVAHHNVLYYFCLIFLTIWVVFGLSSDLVWKLFKDLPLPPEQLDTWI